MRSIEEDVLKVLITKDEIDNRCKELADKLHKDYQDENPIFICILKGALPFFAKMLEHLKFEMEIECVRVKSYDGMNSTGNVQIDNFNFDHIKDRHVIIVEDIIDTGLTMKKTTDLFKSKGVKSLEILALLNKPVLNQVQLNPKYIGFEIPHEFVIGFGLDYNEQYRNLPYIGVLKPEAIKK